MFENVKDLFSDLESDVRDHVAILLHRSPDPDAIGCAVGLKYMINKSSSKKVEIYYSGFISHPQNKTMVNLLNVRLEEMNHDEDTIEKSIKIFTDTTENNIDGSFGKDIFMTVDHHKAKSKAHHTFIEMKI